MERHSRRLKRSFFRGLIILGLLAAALQWNTLPAYADIRITITVTDCDTGWKIEGVRINVPTSTKPGRVFTTNSSGVATLSPVRPGDTAHRLVIRKNGYQTYTINQFFAANSSASFVICLKSLNPPAPVVTEPPLVETEPPLVVTEEPAITEQPPVIEEPAITVEPVVTEPPQITEEPIVTEEPLATEPPPLTTETPPSETNPTWDIGPRGVLTLGMWPPGLEQDFNSPTGIPVLDNKCPSQFNNYALKILPEVVQTALKFAPWKAVEITVRCKGDKQCEDEAGLDEYYYTILQSLLASSKAEKPQDELAAYYAGTLSDPDALKECLGFGPEIGAAAWDQIVWFQRMMSTNLRSVALALHSPAGVLVIDNLGRKSGFYQNGATDNDIPNAAVTIIGETKVVILPQDAIKDVEIVGQDNGVFALDIIRSLGIAVVEYHFEKIPVTAGDRYLLKTNFLHWKLSHTSGKSYQPIVTRTHPPTAQQINPGILGTAPYVKPSLIASARKVVTENKLSVGLALLLIGAVILGVTLKPSDEVHIPSSLSTALGNFLLTVFAFLFGLGIVGVFRIFILDLWLNIDLSIGKPSILESLVAFIIGYVILRYSNLENAGCILIIFLILLIFGAYIAFTLAGENPEQAFVSYSITLLVGMLAIPIFKRHL